MESNRLVGRWEHPTNSRRLQLLTHSSFNRHVHREKIASSPARIQFWLGTGDEHEVTQALVHVTGPRIEKPLRSMVTLLARISMTPVLVIVPRLRLLDNL